MDWVARSLERILNFLIRPKLTESEAFEIMQNAAKARGWEIGPIWPLDLTSGLYSAASQIAGTEIMVVFMVDGRSGEVLQIERSDELEDTNDDPNTQ